MFGDDSVLGDLDDVAHFDLQTVRVLHQHIVLDVGHSAEGSTLRELAHLPQGHRRSRKLLALRHHHGRFFDGRELWLSCELLIAKELHLVHCVGDLPR